jgi:hypothetical protein
MKESETARKPIRHSETWTFIKMLLSLACAFIVSSASS